MPHRSASWETRWNVLLANDRSRSIASSADTAQRLERTLKETYPSIHVFRDESGLVPGSQYLDRLREEVDAADLVLVLADDNRTGGSGLASRLHDPRNVLRREIERAFHSKASTIPVLLEDAQMPSRNDLPDVVGESRGLHAQRLKDDSYSTWYGRLLKENPERLGAAIKPLLEQAQKYMPGESAQGEGVPLASVSLEGGWECEAVGPTSEVSLRFSTQGTADAPFRGEVRARGVGVATIKGTWMPIIDPAKALLLGLVLDGLWNGAGFKLDIPIHRRLGGLLVGTDSTGVTYSSRNVDPRRKGF